MTIRNVVLIGGSGFIGGWVAQKLAARGIRVVVPARRRDPARRLILLPTVYATIGNVNEPQALAELMRGTDAVINLAGILHDKSRGEPYGRHFAATHVELPKKIIAAMKTSGVRRLIHLSALKAAADAPSAYLRSKAAGEAVVRAAENELEVTVFRPSVVFGRGDAFLNRFARLLKFSPFLPLVGADTRFQPVYAGDVAGAIASSLADPATYGKTYELVGPKTYRLRELVDYVGDLTGQPRPVLAVSGPLAALQAGLLGLLPNPPLTKDNLRSLEVDNVADGSLARPGWQPTALEAVAPGYLVPWREERFDAFRTRARR